MYNRAICLPSKGCIASHRDGVCPPTCMLADVKETWRYRELIVALAMREVRVRYKHALLGIGWAVIMPLVLMLVFTEIFSRVASISTGGIPYPLFAYTGLLAWQLHANIIQGASRCLSDNSNLVTKVYFPRQVLPASVVLSALVDFAVAALLLAGLMAVHRVTPGWQVAFVPLVLALQLSLASGLALFVSAANLFYRDVQFILQVGVQLWMFASSVLYPLPSQGVFAWVNLVNPMTPILDAWRYTLLGAPAPRPESLAAAAGLSLLTLVLGWAWFRRAEARFGELA